MTFFNLFRSVSSPEIKREPIPFNDEAIVKGLISAQSKTDTLLNLGLYIEESDVDALRARVTAHDFLRN